MPTSSNFSNIFREAYEDLTEDSYLYYASLTASYRPVNHNGNKISEEEKRKLIYCKDSSINF